MAGKNGASANLVVLRIRRSARLGLTALVLAVVTALPAPRALGVVLSCGDPVTTNTTLTANVTCNSGGSGLIIDGASGITLDLNGFTIATASSPPGVNDYGISVTNSSRVKIVNGTVQNFTYQINIDSSSSVTVDNVLVRGGIGQGLNVVNSSGITVNNVVALDTGSSDYGLYFSDNVGALTVSNSSIAGFLEGISVTASVAGKPAFTTTLSGNNIVAPRTIGIEYKGLAGDLVAKGNVVVDSQDKGIYLDCDASFDQAYGPVTLADNRVLRSGGPGMFLTDCRRGKSAISGNVSSSNGTGGFYLSNLPNATVSNNRASSNGTGFEAYLIGGSTLKSNRADLNATEGFFLADNDLTRPAAITGNFARGNGTNGFLVTNAGDLSSVSDGNVAFGNTSLSQCVGITCVDHVMTGTTLKSCGDSVTTSIVLGGDVNGCNADGGAVLVVPSGSRITIDLNGYSIDAGGLAKTGILLSGVGSTNVTIRNGVIKGFKNDYLSAVVLSGATPIDLKLENVLFETELLMNGITINTASSSVSLTDVILDHSSNIYGTGLSPENSDITVTVSQSLFNSWLAPMRLPTKIEGTQVLNSYYGIGYDYSGAVPPVPTLSVANSVVSSRFGGIGMSCTVGGSATASGNILVGNPIDSGLGIASDGCASGSVTNNRVLLQGAKALLLQRADGFTITGNRAFDNNFGFELHFGKATAVIKGNFSDINYGASGDGIRLVADVAGAGVRSFANNFARGNGYDGFFFSGSNLKSSGNIAFANGHENCTSVICSIGPVLLP